VASNTTACAPSRRALGSRCKKRKNLYKAIGVQKLTLEEFVTILTRIKAVLNSRPLCRNSDSYLTPAHFLVSEALLDLPNANFPDVPLVKRYKLVQQILNTFWAEWTKIYLRQLQVRTKWKDCQQSIKVGDMVLIHKDHVKSIEWPMDLITRVTPGSDGLVRVATIKTAKGAFMDRPIQKIVKLPVSID